MTVCIEVTYNSDEFNSVIARFGLTLNREHDDFFCTLTVCGCTHTLQQETPGSVPLKAVSNRDALPDRQNDAGSGS